MPDLESITSGVMIVTLGASIVGGLPLAVGMSYYAQSYNQQRRQDFLERELGKHNCDELHVELSYYDPIRKDMLLTPIQLHEKSYVLESRYKKSFWLANQFYDTRLYEPINLVSKRGLIQNEIL